jgi:hypothetical protein
MAPQLNHTIAWCTDKVKSAGFLAHILGLPEPRRFFHFLVVDLSNDVSIDYFETTEHVALQHFAFLVSEENSMRLLRASKLWELRSGQIRRGRNRVRSIITTAGRGVYFKDPTVIFLSSSRGLTAVVDSYLCAEISRHFTILSRRRRRKRSYASSLQFVRKLSGFTKPSKANEEVFNRAVEQVNLAAEELIRNLVSNAPPRDREIEAAKAKARAAERYA